MQFYGHAEAAAESILNAFKAGTLPAALAQVFIHRKDARPCASWSWSNQLIIALAGHTDARGFRQWQEVGRYVSKGERAVHILVPIVKREEVEDETGEKRERQRIVGFKSAPVFGYSQTHGEPLPEEREADSWIAQLPLVDVARAWGLKVATYNGRPGAALGKYRHGQAIALGVENLSTWAHELVHAADDRLGNLKERGQHWRSEVVAELGGAILLECLGLTREADRGGAWEYIRGYCEREGKDPVGACMGALKRTCEAVALILDTAEKVGSGPDGPDGGEPAPEPAPSPKERPTPPAAAAPEPEAPEKSRYTIVPDEWLGVALYHWRGKGYRTRGSVALKGAKGRPVKHFAWDGFPELAKLPVGAPQLVRAIKAQTDEVWPVYERRGKFWSRSFYFVPRRALELARAELQVAAEPMSAAAV